jgi:hypothetical protein
MLMEIPVVAISAAPMNGPQQPLRVDATLPKPFDPDALAWLATRMTGRKSFFQATATESLRVAGFDTLRP